VSHHFIACYLVESLPVAISASLKLIQPIVVPFADVFRQHAWTQRYDKQRRATEVALQRDSPPRHAASVARVDRVSVQNYLML
jgi:hypothetical protein